MLEIQSRVSEPGFKSRKPSSGNPVLNTTTERNWDFELALGSWKPFLFLFLHSAKLIPSDDPSFYLVLAEEVALSLCLQC